MDMLKTEIAELRRRITELEALETRRQQAEEELKESEEKYRLITENSLSGIFIIQRGKIKYTNPRFAQMVGFEPEEIIGQEALRFLHPDDRQWVDEQARRRLKGEDIPPVLEMRLLTQNGEISWVEAIYSLCQYGDRTAMIVNVVDINERKRAEEALRESEEKYRQLFGNESDAVMVFDADTMRFEDANKATLDLYGYSMEEFLPLTAEDISAEKEKTRIAVQKVKNGEPGSEQVPVRYFRKKDGTVFPGEIYAGTFISGGRKKIIGSVRDITKRKRTEEELRKTKDELEVKSGNLEELNTALRVLLKSKEEDKKELEENVYSNVRKLIIPYIEKLKMSPLDDKQMVYVDIVESNLNDIISPFLHRLGSKHLNLTPKEIQVVSLVKEGKTSKETAELLNVSQKAIEFHRNNIRMKLGLKNKQGNLISHLLSLF